MNQEWSDTESSDEENSEEYEDEEFDMYELAKKTANNMTDDFFVKEEKKVIDKPLQVSFISPKISEPKQEYKQLVKRKFNPRLPPPNKYNKINDNKFNLNLKDFPTL